MKKSIAAVAALSVLATGTSALAQSGRSATAVATATGTVVKPIVIVANRMINFSRFVAPAAATTLTIEPAGGSGTGANVDPSGILLTANSMIAPNFLVVGEPNTTFAITLPTSVEIVSGANKMTVNGFNTQATVLDLGAGSRSFSVGATLNVGANQATGSYSGNFPVIVNYN